MAPCLSQPNISQSIQLPETLCNIPSVPLSIISLSETYYFFFNCLHQEYIFMHIASSTALSPTYCFLNSDPETIP